MNDEIRPNPEPAYAVPPPFLTHSSKVAEPPLGQGPCDDGPVSGFIATAEAIVRHPRRIYFQLLRNTRASVMWWMLIVAILCSIAYGVIVGTFSGGQQFWIAPVKIAGGLVICGLICLPSLFIFSCLSGAQARLGDVFGLLTGMLALTAILLIGLGPVAWVFSQSTESLAAIGALHLVFWAIAIAFGLKFMARGFAHVNGARNRTLLLWSAIYVIVVLQMTTALRPIIGTSDHFFPEKKQFFLSHWADNLAASKD
jgi:hypothetical protein